MGTIGFTKQLATVALILIFPKGGATSSQVDNRCIENNTFRRTTSTVDSAESTVPPWLSAQRWWFARGPRESHGGRARAPAGAFRVFIPGAIPATVCNHRVSLIRICHPPNDHFIGPESAAYQ